jgi:hypothetical protein
VARRKLETGVRLAKQDNVSVDRIVDELRASGKYAVAHHNPVENEFSFGMNLIAMFNEKTFIGYVTNDGMAKLHKFGGRVISMDGTHHVTRYKSQLITMVVQTEKKKKAYPFGFLFVKQESKACLLPFFAALADQYMARSVKSYHLILLCTIIYRYGEPLNTQFFMSDSSPAFCFAWCEAWDMTSFAWVEPQRLRCDWHRKKNLLEHLPQKKHGQANPLHTRINPLVNRCARYIFQL